ncbi:MAG: DUF3108 domain-containing protein [Bacteroidota bacterium]
MRYLIAFCFLLILTSAILAPSGTDPNEDRPFSDREELYFKIHFGWFTIGKGSVKLRNEALDVAEDTYSVEAEGRTVGLLGIFANLEDRFTAKIDGSSLKPIEATRSIKDGRYWRNQKNRFYFEDTAAVHIKIEDLRDESKSTERLIGIGDSTFDILSSYLYLRSIDWASKQVADSVMIGTFYGKKIYDFGVEYAGTEKIRFKGEKFLTHKLYVLFPNSTVFPEDRPVTVWVTADENQLPLKISARLGIGKATVELSRYENLRSPRRYF